MPDRRGATRVAAALSAGLLAVLLAGPTALAQTDEVPPSEDLDPGQPQPPAPPEEPEQHPPGSWGASNFEAPFDVPDATLRDETFDIIGTLRYQKTGPSDFVQEVEVRVVDDPDDSFTPGDACALPSPTRIPGDGPRAGFTAEQVFAVSGVSLPCNGRYLVEAEGRLEDPDAETYTLRQSFVLAAPPRSVTGLGLTLNGEARSVTATFQPLSDEDLAPDAIGYVLERSGPEGGTYVDVATIDVDDDPRFVDPLADAPAGTYTYRVRAVRAGADGDVRSSLTDAESDTVDVEGDPVSTSASPRATAGRSGATSSRFGGRVTRTGTTPRLTTPTTLDTGFDDELDYGARGEGSRDGDDPLAGASIVRDEGDGMGLAVPAAGALVMLGWAGHILYLNRLAKQL
jgi:hypothetical protein